MGPLAGASRLSGARSWMPVEKGHSSPNCSTKPELPGLYLAWLASMTQTSKAVIEVLKKKKKNNKAQREATGQQHARDRNEKETSVKPSLWQYRTKSPSSPMELVWLSWIKRQTPGQCGGSADDAAQRGRVFHSVSFIIQLSFIVVFSIWWIDRRMDWWMYWWTDG